MAEKKPKGKKTDGLTPMMQQYSEIKKENQDCILMYRLGDFYEMFLTTPRRPPVSWT